MKVSTIVLLITLCMNYQIRAMHNTHSTDISQLSASGYSDDLSTVARELVCWSDQFRVFARMNVREMAELEFPTIADITVDFKKE